jgi:hypothetical protein
MGLGAGDPLVSGWVGMNDDVLLHYAGILCYQGSSACISL